VVLFSDNELEESSVVKQYLTTAADGKGYQTKHYGLQAIIAVGFKCWTMDSERLKHGLNYDPSATATKHSFAAVQNKMHYAMRGRIIRRVMRGDRRPAAAGDFSRHFSRQSVERLAASTRAVVLNFRKAAKELNKLRNLTKIKQPKP